VSTALLFVSGGDLPLDKWSSASFRFAKRFTMPCCGTGMIRPLLTGRPRKMKITVDLIPLLSIIAGVLVLAVPKFLRYVVGIYLIAIGLIQLLR
jgi:uncharacterized membrane protein HdeD (DUF308 family)